MMKLFLKLIMLFAFALTSVSVCFADEMSSSPIESVYNQAHVNCDDSNNAQDNHHCVCPLSCNSLILNFYNTVTPQAYLLSQLTKSTYSFSFYPPIYLSLDKPPTV